MEKAFEEQCDIYRKQQTVSGQRTQRSLDQMVDRMNRIRGVNVKSGTLTPVKHYLSDEIKSFIER